LLLMRVEQSDWLSNAYLVVDGSGGKGVLVDSNLVTDPLAEFAEREGVEITQLLLTHHHYDHVVGARALADRFGAPIHAHQLTEELIGDRVDATFADGDVIETGALRIEVMQTPGHCADHCALAFNGTDVLTADVLFKGTVGGTRAPGATGFADLKTSVMEKLMNLAPETRIHPGHREPSTIGAEWEHNPFVRIWRGLDEEGSEPVTIGPADAAEREPATMILWAPDYDGGNKAWVRFEDGSDAIVGGSQIKREK
jgi:hydroxyacylglutathione hydrolase